MSNPFLEAALSYAKRGWAVFPLVPRGKTPLTSNGFKSATTDEAQIKAWWLEHPTANVGIATGAISGLVVLDFDKKHGGVETFNKYIEEELDCTYEVHTGGGGYHLYYLHPGFEVRNRAGFRPGMDVRGDGGYVVAPPSIHESGNEYCFGEIFDHPEMQHTCHYELQPLPAWVAQPPAPPRETKEMPERASVLSEGEKGTLAKSTLQFILDGAAPGTWHAEMYKACIDLKQQHYSFDEAMNKIESAGIVLDVEHDIPLLEDVYENREPKHPPRVSSLASAPSESLAVKASALGSEMLAFLSDKSKVKGEPTGIEGLDKLLGGGYRMGEVTCWHAEAKTGKNTLWHKLMHLFHKAGKGPMGYASRELTPETEVIPNFLSLEFQENAWLSELTPEAQARYTSAVASWEMYFARGYGHLSFDDIVRWTDELMNLGVRIFWFDHLHYMIEDPEDHKEASKLIKNLKTLAKEKDINIQIIIQPNKLAEGYSLGLNSIKGGSAMGQAIDNLIVLERMKDVENVCKLSLKACRSKLGKLGSIHLQYNPSTTDFIEGEFEKSVEITVPVRKSWGREHELEQ
jgi:hypothetical protein